jgi:outer membrane autotransporter protein
MGAASRFASSLLRNRGTRRGASQMITGMLGALLLVATPMASATTGFCEITITPQGPIEAQAGDLVSFNIVAVLAEGQSEGNCGMADVRIEEIGSSTASATVSPPLGELFGVVFNEPEPVSVQIGAAPNTGSVSYQVVCLGGCDSNPPSPTITINVGEADPPPSDYTIGYKDGVSFFEVSGTSPVSVTVAVSKAGSPTDEGSVCFQFASNPGAATLTGGSGTCGEGGRTVNPESGVATVTFDPNGDLCGSVQLGATASFPDGSSPSLPLTVIGDGVQALTPISGDGQAAFVDQPFDEPLVVQFTCGDTPVVNRDLRWFLEYEPEGTVIDGSDVVATDEEGMAQVKLVAGSQTGSFSVRSIPSLLLVDGEGIRQGPASITRPKSSLVEATFEELTVQNFYELEHDASAEIGGSVDSEVELGVRLSINGDAAFNREIIYTLLSSPEGAFGNLESPTSVFTDEIGTAVFTLVPDATGTWVVEAVFDELTGTARAKASGASPLALQFTITVDDGIVMVRNSDGIQPGYPGSTRELAVRVLSGEAGVPDEVITWNVDAGPAMLSAATSETNSDGVASIQLTYGPGTGAVVVTATRQADSDDTVEFGDGESFQWVMTEQGSIAVNTGANSPTPFEIFLERDSEPRDPANGQSISWVADGPGSTSISGGELTDDNGLATANVSFMTDGEYTVTATFTDPEPPEGDSPQVVSVEFSVTVAGADLVFVSQPETPIYTDETTSDGVVVQAREFDGEGFVGETGVTVTFDIISGTAAFVGGSAQAVVVTDEIGYAESPAIEVGLGSSDIVIQASAGGVEPVDFTLPVTLSTYVLRLPDGTPDPIVGTAGSSIPLAVVLERTGSGPTVPMSGEEITWDNSGGTLAAPTSVTGASGEAVNSISSLIPDTYTVIPQFIDEAFGGDYPQISITVQIDAATATLDIVSGDAQSALPGEALPDPLVVRALDGGNPPTDPIDINWTVAPLGAATFETTPSSTDETGEASVNVTLSANAVPGPITITATRADSGTATTFTATVQPLVVKTITIISGDGQSAPAGQSLAQPLVVEVLDDGLPPANPVPMNWIPSQAGVVIFNGSAELDANGRGQFDISFQPDAPPGPITITVQRADTGASVIFQLTVDPPVSTSLAPVSGDNQAALAGQSLPLPLVVVAADDNEPPAGPVTINWSVAPLGAASFDVTPSSTDEAGESSVIVTLSANAQPGQITITATRADSGDEAVFTAVVQAAIVTSLEVVTGNNQGALPGESLADPLVVRATDDNAPPTNAVTINWAVAPLGAATVATTPSSTGETGLSSVTVTLSPNAQSGQITITASRADSGDEAVFTAFVQTAAVTSLAVVSGDNQTALAGQALPLPLVVVATDDNEPPLSPIGIVWTVAPQGAATLAPLPSSTDPQTGEATITVTFAENAQPGQVTISASRVDSGDAVSFTAVVLAPTVTALTVVAGSGQAAEPGQPLALPLVVAATNNNEPPLSPVTITWTTSPPGKATFAPVPSVTDPQTGQASITVTLAAEDKPPGSPNEVFFIVATRSDSGDQATFQATMLAPVLKTLVKPQVDSGDGQSAPVGSQLPLPLQVLALDNSGGASGVTINWSVTGDAALSAAQTVTDTSGGSAVGVTFGNNAGVVTVVASRQDAPAASTSFVLTAEAAPVAALQIIDGDGQTGLINRSAQPLRVRYSIDGVPQAGIPVSWSVQSGAATLSQASSTTAADGTATIDLVFGATPGPVVVRAQSGDAFADFALTAVAGILSIEAGNGQSGASGSTLPQDFIARVSLPGGANVSVQGLVVEWAVLEGGGTLAAASGSTDAAGLASNRLTLGSAPGTNIVRASIEGGSTVQFVATSVGPALSIVGGTAQRGPMQTPGDGPLVVALLTANGQPLTARTVQWQVLSGPVILDASSSQTDASGRATIGFRYGDVPGPAVVRATAADAVGFVDFTLESLQAALMGAASGNDQTGRPVRELAADFVVSIAPPNGKALGGVTVFWQVTEGGGTLRSATSLTDAAGLARNRLTLGTELGINRVVASIPGGGDVVFTAEAVAPAGTLRIVSGNSQTLPTNDPSAPLVVEVVDVNGAPLQGVRVRWTGLDRQLGGIATPGAAVADEVTVTNAQGRTSTTATVLLPGAARVEARTVDAITSPVVFNLNGGVANIPGLDEGQRGISGAIDNACPALAALPNRTAAQEDLYRRCLELIDNAGDNPDEVRRALDQIPSELGDSMVNAAFGAIGTQFSNHSQRFEVLRKSQAGGKNQFNIALWTPTGVMPLSFLPSAIVAASDDESSEVGSEFDRWGFFATGTIGRGKSRGLDQQPGFEFDTSGLTAGVDYRFSDRLVGGVSLGYTRNDSEIRGGNGSVDTRGWTVSGYASWFNDRNWYLDGVLSYGNNDYSLDRALAYTITALDGGRTVVDQRARGDTDGNLLGTSLSFGRDFQKGAWNFSTYLRGNYSRIELDAYEERMLAGVPGAGLALRFDSRTLNSVTSALGGKATWVLSREWGVLMPHAQVEWEHEFRDSPGNLVARFAHDPTNTPIATTGVATDSDYFNVGVGVSALFPGGRAVYMYYERLMGASRLSQGTLSLGARFEF